MINSFDKKCMPMTMLIYVLLPLSDLLFSVYLVRYFIESYEKGVNVPEFTFIMLLLLIFQIIVWGVESYYTEVFSLNSNLKISRGIYRKLFLKINSTQMKEMEGEEFFQKYYFVFNDCEERAEKYVEYLSIAVSSLVMLFTLVGIIVNSSPILFIFVVFPILFEMIIVPSLKKIVYEYDIAKKEEMRKADYTKRVMYFREYAKEIRTTRVWNVVWKQYNDCLKETKRLISKYGTKIAIRNVMIEYAYQVVAFLSLVVFVLHGIYNNSIELSSGIIIVTTYNQIVYSVKNIVDLVPEGYSQSFYIDAMFEFLRVDESLDTAQKADVGMIETIEFRNVSFAYDNEEYILNNINFKLKRGQKTAILGMNGAGKTTLIKLLIGQYEPDKGEILVNGINIKEINVDNYQKRISTVLQNFKVFATTIEKNIIEKSIENELELENFQNAVEKSGLSKKLAQLPKGSKTIISKEFDEEGINLSGGEMQKVAIARAIAKDAELLIMDEPTSALDPIAETNFYNMMEKNFLNNIVVYVSHNYSSALFADNIIFLSGGRISEMGTHSDLIEQNGEYSKMYKMQVKNFNRSRHEVS